MPTGFQKVRTASALARPALGAACAGPFKELSAAAASMHAVTTVWDSTYAHSVTVLVVRRVGLMKAAMTCSIFSWLWLVLCLPQWVTGQYSFVQGPGTQVAWNEAGIILTVPEGFVARKDRYVACIAMLMSMRCLRTATSLAMPTELDSSQNHEGVCIHEGHTQSLSSSPRKMFR